MSKKVFSINKIQVNQTELSSGLHKFNFACQLPIQLPTSFESKYGYIRYQIKVELERPWKIDVKFCFAFTVIKVLDLNFESPALRSPLKTETTKTFFLGLSGKPLFLSAEVPISGFVAGQSVPISIKVNNESGTDVDETKISLKKIIHYNSQTPRRKTRERIESAAEVRHSGVPAKSKGNIEALLNLPPVPPTNTSFCRVLQVSYEIHVVAKVGGIHRSPVLRLPITIGTVPLNGYQYTPTNVSLSNWNMQPSTSSTNVAPYSVAVPSAPVTFDLRKNNLIT
jgi:Arrestin (or S-antigen), N-terminal domain/Arrestin (or S-antigen), C-terminal domain